MNNPLLNQNALPPFSAIHPEHIEPALKHVIEQNQRELADILSKIKTFSWENLMSPLEEMENRIARVWAPVNHMHSVVESELLRKAYHVCLPLLTEYGTSLSQNEKLFHAIQSISESKEYSQLTDAQRKIIQNELRDFKLAGVSLPEKEKKRFAEIQKKLSELSTKFAENLLDATKSWVLHIADKNLLAGLSQQIRDAAESDAKERGKTGWIFTLEFPSYSAVMKYLDNRDLRKKMYEAYMTRASDQGPDAGRFDNSAVMDELLKTRHEKANLLGFPTFAHYSLATKMAKTPERVLNFLNDLVQRSKKIGEKDLQEMTEISGMEKLEAWDLPYYSEKLRQKKYAISQEEIRTFFPVDTVLSGMFSVFKKLFGIEMRERFDVDTWHPSVQFFDVFDENNELRGSFYTDLYARPNKRDGAWMDDCCVRRRLPNGTIQTPIAFLTCNFSRPLANQPALLTHEDVLTVFHEFGHCLHHLLTRVENTGVSGINGVLWDAVEFPSQLMEFWCWEKEVIQLISKNLPDELFHKMILAKNFQPGLHMLRQLEFSLFDFRLHLEYQPNEKNFVQKIVDDVREKVAVIPFPKFNRFQNTFSHIFAGAYSAGYYSYKWAEVLSADAYSLFEETGVLNSETGKSFVKNILERGGVEEPMKLFIAFRGREPKIDALLKYSGL